MADPDESVAVADAPPIPGLRFRRFRDERDYEHMARVFDGVRIADDFDLTMTAEEFAHWSAPRAEFDPRQEIVFAEVDGEVVAFSNLDWYQEADGTRLYVLIGRVSPPWRRKGLGRAMLRHNERRLREIAATHPAGGRREFVSYAADTAVGTETLLRQEGYAPVRHFYDMVRDLTEPIPAAPLPPGLEIRPAAPEHYRVIWDALQEAIQDHWGAWPATEDDYQRWRNDPNFDPTLWQVAWDGDQVAGQVLSFIRPEENTAFGRQRGYTEEISVRRPWRKQGLARALINRSLHLLRERGMAEAALMVDTDNLSGALRLYESCGFRVLKRTSHYRKPLDAAPGAEQGPAGAT